MTLPLHTLALGDVWQESLAMIPAQPGHGLLLEEQTMQSTYVLAERDALKLVIACLLSTVFASGQVRLSIQEENEQVVMQMSGRSAPEMKAPQEQAAHALGWLLCQRLVEGMAGRLCTEKGQGDSTYARVTLKRGVGMIPSFFH